MVNYVDKKLRKICRNMEDLEDMIEAVSYWDDCIRDETGTIVEVQAWLGQEHYPTLHYLLTFACEQEVRQRFSLMKELEFILTYWGTKFALRAWNSVSPQTKLILQKILGEEGERC